MKIYFTSLSAKLKTLVDKLVEKGEAVPKPLQEYTSTPRPLDKNAPIVPEPPTV